MSDEKNLLEARRWLDQAQADIHAARISSDNESFEWACFQSQQAGEKALKAVWIVRGLDPWGHSILRLIDDFPGEDAWRTTLTSLLDDASDLDKLYIPTRYPNGLPELTPHRVFREKDARAAIGSAERIIKRANSLIENR